MSWATLREKSLAGLSLALDAEIREELLARRPGLVATHDQAVSAAQAAQEQRDLALIEVTVLQRELRAVQGDITLAEAALGSSERDDRVSARIDLSGLRPDAESLTQKLADARAAADALSDEASLAVSEAELAALRLALFDRAAGDPQGSLIGKETESWAREFEERGWLATMRKVQRGEDVAQYDMLRMMSVLKDVMIRSGFKEMFVAEGVDRARHGPLTPVNVEFGRGVADAATARLRGQLTDGRTQGRSGDVRQYSPER